MTVKSASNHTQKSSNLVYVSAIYLGIDSGKLSMSMIKYSFDILLKNNDLALKAMQEWVSTPVGGAITGLGIFSFTGFSLISNYLETDNKYLGSIIILWPYVRESLKSLRNALRGVSSTLNLFYILNINDLRELIVPLGLTVGLLSALNRIWIRYNSNYQSDILKKNLDLLIEINSLKKLSPEQIELFRNIISAQSKHTKFFSYFGSVLTGLIDGINPYIGALALGTLAPPMLALVTLFCSLYLLATVTIRLYDEINRQDKLLFAKKEIELALLEKEIIFLLNRLEQLSKLIRLTPRNKIKLRDEYHTLSIYLDYKLLEQKQETQKLDLLHKNLPALVQGTKNGLNIYKYLMLAISTCIFLSPIKLPSIQAQHRAMLGMSMLGSGILYEFFVSFLKHWDFTRAKQEKQNDKINKLQESTTLSEEKPNLTETQNSFRFFSSCSKPSICKLTASQSYQLNTASQLLR